MKDFAKLVLFFTVSFILILTLAALVIMLGDWAEAAALYPPAEAVSGSLSAALDAAMPAAFYWTLLVGICYGIQRRIAYPAVMIVLLTLALILSTGAFMGINRFGPALPSGLKTPAPQTQSGLLFTLAPGPPPTRAILLESRPDGGRVLALPRQPLYFEPVSSEYRLRPLRFPFRENNNPVLKGISGDFGRSARVMRAWFDAGLAAFIVYAGSLGLFLVSLGCLVNISFWPLANLFFGALAFRGALAFEVFLNSAETQRLLTSFAGGFLPDSLVSPAVWTVSALLILLYSGLVYLARGKRNE